MDIYFDFELDDNADQPEDPKNLVYESLRQFVQTRYRVLDDQIYILIVQKTIVPSAYCYWNLKGLL